MYTAALHPQHYIPLILLLLIDTGTSYEVRRVPPYYRTRSKLLPLLVQLLMELYSSIDKYNIILPFTAL